MADAAAFTQLVDRGLACEGSLAAWCPTMDLLALATADGQLHLHRLNWQRLWWTSPDAPITALEWRPDGKQLAVGLEDGSVLLLNTEDGEVAQRARLLPDALVAISWTESAAASGGTGSTAGPRSSGSSGGEAASASGHLAEDRTRRMFAPPPPAVPAAAAGLAVGYATCGKHGTGVAAWPPEPARLAVLACASAAGELVLCTSALFPLATVRLPQLLGCPAVSVLRLATAPSLQQLAVCWREDGGSPLRLSTISLQAVGSHAPQLHRLALAAAQVGSLLEGCRASLAAACKEWGAGQREFEESRRRLANLMSDYGSTGDPASELHGLLTTGAVGGALQQYLTATLGEPGLKKLARAVDAAVCSVHNLLTDHLQPQLEQLAFRLGELRGLALCLPWRRVTGLQPDQVGGAEQTALRLLMLAETLRRRLVAAGASYRTFFSWLLIILRRMQEDAADVLAGYPRSHLESVSDFLSGQFQQDAVGPLLGSTEGGSGSEGSGGGDASAAAAAAGSSSSGGGSMLDVLMEVLGRQALVQAADSTAASPTGGAAAAAVILDSGSGSSSSLAQLLAGLDAACSAAFDRTSAVISPTLAVTSSLSLGPSPSGLSLGYIPTGSEAADASLVAAAAWEGQQHVLLLRSTDSSGSSREQEGSEAAVLLLPGSDSVTDLALYKEGRLALLLAGSACRLALLPPDAVQWVQLPPDLLAEADALQLAQMLLESAGGGSGTAWPEEAARQRVLPYPRAQAPLAVSASRGVGCVLAGTQRVVLYDLEEDEAEEEEEEAEGAAAAGEDGMESDYETPAGSM
ncbi:anaphase-promoting complex subunit 4 [Chlorella sorokiniana]|uniref:Anaphase-promoting complex subunit 4 n=1 Tax=Chlorella sorokiniana TaxID=3076 RepID=A0A2P6TBB4_CHLSO|nr:anaphase-promoting complex subunit 4 [Chlorella sorokiniana]|eukprot:PRW05834.1 anaphase-promoting complex subunit 4 [Chlorella sorokiniana]